MAFQPKVGSIIRIHSWHGVVLKVFTGKDGGTVLQVQTARNVFRGYPPEFVEVEAGPELISAATRSDLDAEIRHLQRMREIGLQKMLESIVDENGDE